MSIFSIGLGRPQVFRLAFVSRQDDELTSIAPLTSIEQKMFGEFLVEVEILESRILPAHRLPRFPRQFTPLARGEKIPCRAAPLSLNFFHPLMRVYRSFPPVAPTRVKLMIIRDAELCGARGDCRGTIPAWRPNVVSRSRPPF